MKKLINSIILLAGIILSAGCASGVGKLEVGSLSQVGNDEIIVVGKIKLDPVLADIEQELKPDYPLNIFPLYLFDSTETRYKNKMLISINSKPIDITHNEAQWEKHITTVDLEKIFFIRVKKANIIYYSGGIIKTSSSENHHNKLFFPSSVKYQIRSDDKAIYIGTFEYYRDFNSVEKITMLNEYQEAKQEFVKKFGNAIQLRPVKPQKT